MKKPDFEASSEQVKHLQKYLKEERTKLIKQAVFRISGQTLSADAANVS